MNSGWSLVFGAVASLGTLIVATFLISGGETVTVRGPELVQLPKNTSPVIKAPAAIAPTPTPLPPPPASALPLDPGIWSTPAQFAPPEVE